MTRKAPAYQVYPAQELVRMWFLDLAQRGLFQTTKFMCWENQKISLEEFHAIASTMAPEMPQASLEKVQKMFHEDDGFLIDNDLEIQRREHAEFRKRQSKNASERWEVREIRNKEE